MSPLVLGAYVLCACLGLGSGLFVCWLLALQGMVLYYAVLASLSESRRS